MKLIIASFAVIAASFAAECPPRPAPHPMGDAAPPLPQGGASAPALAACANLADAGCEDGLRPNCGVTIDKVVAQRLIPIDVACLTTEHTKAELRKCGARCE
jgi:hypothetical protein